jgi:hypothetical protein
VLSGALLLLVSRRPYRATHQARRGA